MTTRDLLVVDTNVGAFIASDDQGDFADRNFAYVAVRRLDDDNDAGFSSQGGILLREEVEVHFKTALVQIL